MPTCAVAVCNKKSNTSSLQKDGVTFHIFPKMPLLKDYWTKLCKRNQNWAPTRTSTVCSIHFESSQFQCLPNKRRKLINNAVPTLFLSDTDTQTIPIVYLQSVSCAEKENGNVDSNIEFTKPPPSSIDSPRQKKLKEKLKAQTKKVKRLQSKTRYLEKKVASLQEIIKTSDDKHK